MPVFYKNDKSVLFVHIPKAGGTTVEHKMVRNGWKVDLHENCAHKDTLGHYMHCPPQHMHMAQLRGILNLAKFDYVFCVMRDPVRRAISEYLWRVKHFRLTKPADEWLPAMLLKFRADPFVCENHIRPQAAFVPERSLGDTFALENGLEQVFGALEQAVGEEIARKPGERLMESSASTGEVIGDETHRALAALYKEDVALHASVKARSL